MNSNVNAMPKYVHRQHVLSDWLAELDQRFQLGEVGEDTNRITWCQLLIGATGSSILSSLDEEATWEDAKEALLTRLGIGSVRDEAWAALKNLKKGSKGIVELAGEAENSPRRGSRLAPRCRCILGSLGPNLSRRDSEIRSPSNGRSRRSRSEDRKNPRGTSGHQDGALGQYDAGSDPNAQERP